MIAKNYRNVFAVLAAAGFVAAGTLLLLLAEFHEEITEPWLSQLDQLTMATIHRWASPGLDKMMFGLSFVGSWKFMPVAAVVVSIVLAWRRCARELLLFALALGGSAILNLGLKAWFHRVRPEVNWALVHEPSFSFPSGHAVAGFTFYATSACLVFRRTRAGLVRAAVVALAVSLIIGIGFSRVYLGFHYPTDVAAGYLVGLVWVSALLLAGRLWDRPLPFDLRAYKDWLRGIGVEAQAVWYASRDPRVPWYSRLFAALVVAYFFSPIDLIPDFTPVVGHLDDLIIVPAGILAAVKLIPEPLMAECREKARRSPLTLKSWAGAVGVLLLWIALTCIVGLILFRVA
ncbi:MAG TPA: phosphatase PAP2 family protein [Candidatus Acidoferrales bacterium]|nr:phosphatase PAP2 family protein [Candidatus Acidoferrales bacterium]